MFKIIFLVQGPIEFKMDISSELKHGQLVNSLLPGLLSRMELPPKTVNVFEFHPNFIPNMNLIRLVLIRSCNHTPKPAPINDPITNGRLAPKSRYPIV